MFLTCRFRSYPLCKEALHLHESVEELLEFYLLDFAQIEYRVSELERTIKNTEEIVSFDVFCCVTLS